MSSWQQGTAVSCWQLDVGFWRETYAASAFLHFWDKPDNIRIMPLDSASKRAYSALSRKPKGVALIAKS
jgi:hypothetical protein